MSLGVTHVAQGGLTCLVRRHGVKRLWSWELLKLGRVRPPAAITVGGKGGPGSDDLENRGTPSDVL